MRPYHQILDELIIIIIIIIIVSIVFFFFFFLLVSLAIKTVGLQRTLHALMSKLFDSAFTYARKSIAVRPTAVRNS